MISFLVCLQGRCATAILANNDYFVYDIVVVAKQWGNGLVVLEWQTSRFQGAQRNVALALNREAERDPHETVFFMIDKMDQLKTVLPRVQELAFIIDPVHRI